MATRQEMLICSIHNWYPKFEEHTFRTVILPLPEAFVSWLTEDGLVLPANTSAFPARARQAAFGAEDDYRDWSSEDESAAESSGNEDSLQERTLPAAFPDLVEAIQEAIDGLGGAVSPKLTWSAPVDATWMSTGNTLRCTTADQVLLLLKSSDRVAHDVTVAVDSCVSDDGQKTEPIQHVLALRKWYDLKPGREFRCFVVRGQLRGISQRDVTQRFEALVQEAEAIRARIEEFHTSTVVTGNFPLSDFAYDCYVPSVATAPVKLVDFNPARATTAALLFSWEELEQGGVSKNDRPSNNADSATSSLRERDITPKEGSSEHPRVVEMRIITDDVPLRPATILYGVPYDFVDGGEGGALNALLEQANTAEDLWGSLRSQTCCEK